MKVLYLTWANNCDSVPEEYTVYFKSKLRHCHGTHVCLTDRPQTLPKKYDHEVVITQPKASIVRDRFLDFWQYLAVHKNYDFVCITDARDVVFQADPMAEVARKFEDKRLILTCEGFCHNVSSFNLIDQMNNQLNLGKFVEGFLNWPVVNGGVILGELGSVRDFCLNVWTDTRRSAGTDQAVINSLYQVLKYDHTVALALPAVSPLCFTGEALAQSLLGEYEPVKKGHVIHHRQGQPYAIFHQWDRTFYRQEILNHALH